MTIEVTCQCGRVLKAPESAAGKKGRCRACGAPIQIPDAAITLEVPDGNGHALAPVSASTAIPLVALADDDQPVSAPPIAIPLASRATSPMPSDLPVSVIDTDEEEEEEANRIPRSPWFYGILEAYAIVSLALGVGQFVLVLLLGGISVALSSTKYAPLSLAFTLMTGLWSFASMVALVIPSAMILLTLDAAKNLRRIRYKLEA